MERAGRNFIVDGIEYNSLPPPQSIVKLTERYWAEQMISTGQIRFGSLAAYCVWENPALGDAREGTGILRVNGGQYTTESSNPIFAWCAALPEITPQRMRQLAHHEKYDCLVRVRDAQVFIRRVTKALAGKYLWLQCGEVSYNKDAEVDLETVNSQRFPFNVFQKDPKFAEDREYRLAITDLRMSYVGEQHILVEIGDCSDILDIEMLPLLSVPTGKA